MSRLNILARAVPALWAFGTVLTMTLATQAQAVQLVTDETIKIQKQLTSKHTLKNGMTVVVREIPDSDILQVNVSFATGMKDLPPGKKALNEWFWATMPMAAKNYSKEKVFSLTEKYGFELGCAAGIEIASCGLGTLNEYWKEGLDLLAAVVKTPTLADADSKLTKDRIIASLRNTPSDPGNYVNEIVNTIYYPVGHPYRLNHDEALAELAKLKPADLKALHKDVLDAARMSIVVVTSKPAAEVVKDLEKAFGGVARQKTKPAVAVTPPVFNIDQSYAFNDRELPTAYIRVKMNAPGVADKDAVASRFMYEILSEELGEEIRTKRSLSYAVHAYTIQYSIGIGVLSVSTSKPKETIEALNDVLKQLKSKTYTTEELDEYKNVFATSYYLTQETHASLASALASSLHFYGNTDELYEMPRRLDQVAPADIKRLATELLSDPRVGIIFGRKDFQDAWAKDFIEKNRRAAPEKKS